MPKSTRSRERATKNGRPNKNCQGASRELDGELLSPEEWIRFGEAHRLSGRELSILALTCQGMTRNAMRRRLHVSLHVVNTYCERLHKKLRTKDRVGMLCELLRFVRGLAAMQTQ